MRAAARVAAALVAAVVVLGGSVPASAAPEPTDARRLGVPEGVSAVLVEASTGQVLAAADATRRRPVASTIKLVTALVAADALPPGARVAVGDEVRGVGGASAGLRPGDELDGDDLLALLLLRSGNDAAVVLATAVAGDEDAFVTRMEERLAGLGIRAELASASGLDAGDRLSAEELATVGRAVLAEPRLAGPAAARELTTSDGQVLANRNLLLGALAGATGLKTGYTEAAGWSLVGSAERDGRGLVAVVLGAASDAERVALAARLLEHGYAGTVVRSTGGLLTLRTGRGSVELRAEAGVLTVPAAAELRLGWPADLDPDAVPSVVELLVDGAPVGTATVTRTDGRAGTAGGAGLGAAAVSGAYAALRAAGAAGLLG